LATGAPFRDGGHKKQVPRLHQTIRNESSDSARDDSAKLFSVYSRRRE